jgi:hypothetical protein
MSLLKQIEDKGAVLEWSPVLSYPNLVALGTKVTKYNSRLQSTENAFPSRTPLVSDLTTLVEN